MKFITAITATLAACLAPGAMASPAPLLGNLVQIGPTTTTAPAAAVTPAINLLQCNNIAYQACNQYNLVSAQCLPLLKICLDLGNASGCSGTSTDVLGNLLKYLGIYINNVTNLSNLLSGILHVPSGNLVGIIPGVGAGVGAGAGAVVNVGAVVKRV